MTIRAYIPFVTLICGLGLSIHPSPGATQDLSGVQDITEIDLEDLLSIEIVTTKTTSALVDAPAVIVVIDREELEWWQYQTVGEVLQHMVGFDVVDDHINQNIGVRGVPSGLFEDNSTIKVMIDGVSVAFRSTLGNWVGLELIPMSAVERIEVIRGPASSIYGADAFLGVINIITRNPEDIDGAELEMDNGVSSEGNYQWTADGVLGLVSGDWSVLLAAGGGQLDRSGIDLPDSSPAPILADPLDREATDLTLDSASVLARVAYSPSENHSVGLVSRFSFWNRGAEFAPWMQLTGGHEDEGLIQTTIALMQLSVGLTYDGTLSDDLTLSAHSIYSMGQPLDGDQIEVGSDIFYVERDFGYNALETLVEANWTPLDELSLVTGLELTYDREQLLTSWNVLKVDTPEGEAGEPLSTVGADRQQDFINLGAFVQARWSIFDEYLGVTGGFRYDWNSIYDSQLSGMAAIVSSPIEVLTAKLIYGTAFKAPSPLLLYAEPLAPGDIIGNESLEPQYIHTLAGSVAYQPISNIIMTATLAYSRLLNKAQFVPVDVNQRAQNIADIETVSVEFEARARWRWLSGYLGFEYVDVVRDTGEEGYRDSIFGTEGVVYPPYSFNLGLTSVLPGVPLRVSAELRYAAASRSSDNNTLEAGHSYEIPEYLDLDATVSTEDLRLWGDRVTVFAASMRDLYLMGDSAPGNAGFDLPLRPTTFWFIVRQEF